MEKKSTAVDLKIASIGGGGQAWAPAFMNDLALCPDLTGEVARMTPQRDHDIVQGGMNWRAVPVIHRQAAIWSRLTRKATAW